MRLSSGRRAPHLIAPQEADARRPIFYGPKSQHIPTSTTDRERAGKHSAPPHQFGLIE
jgi:hypothetical protein